LIGCLRRQGGESSKIGEVSSQTVALTPAESDAINELLVAYRKSLEIQMDKDVPRDRANLADLVNIAELSVRRVIAMAKQVGSTVITFCDVISQLLQLCFQSYYRLSKIITLMATSIFGCVTVYMSY